MKEKNPITYFRKDTICQRVCSLIANIVESSNDSVFWKDVYTLEKYS